jgi:predicted metal-binding membrane protein
LRRGIRWRLALALAGVYSVSPIKRASQARCRELCALHGPLPFNLMRSAAVAGARYGLSCLGCSAALMVAMVLLGMSSLWWAAILGIVVLIYKLAPPLRMRYELALSAALVALGVAYVMTFACAERPHKVQSAGERFDLIARQ